MMLRMEIMMPGRQHNTIPMRVATRTMIHFFCWPLISQWPVPNTNQVSTAAIMGFASGFEILAIMYTPEKTFEDQNDVQPGFASENSNLSRSVADCCLFVKQAVANALF